MMNYLALLEDDGDGEDLPLLLHVFRSLTNDEQKVRWATEYLTLEGRRRRDRRIPREALLEPEQSPWTHLYHSRNDQALITVTGFDHAAFSAMLYDFCPYFYNFTPWTGKHDGTTYKALRSASNTSTPGRPRKIKAHACLGLILASYRFRGSDYQLQGWFGFTGTHASVWIRFARRMLLKTLQSDAAARVTMPSDDKITELQEIVRRKYAALDGTYCFADGLKLYFQSCANEEEQGMYYNGWTHSHHITNLLVFSVDGRIIKCVLNVPGSIHDSTLADWGGVYEELEATFRRTGGKCCVDSAFATDGCDYLIKSAQDITRAKTQKEVLQIRQATSIRQAAEWGMGAIQRAFPKLKDRIRYEESGTERKLFLKLVPLLYNLRLEKVGLNQIRNTYVPEWSKDASYVISSFGNI